MLFLQALLTVLRWPSLQDTKDLVETRENVSNECYGQ